MAKRLATSTTKTDVATDRKAFVTLRFAGDDLDPAEISAILPVAPTRAHKKGEEFVAGPRAGKLRGRTGIWFLATDNLVPSNNLDDHFAFVERLLCPETSNDARVIRLRDILDRTRSHAYITYFRRGSRAELTPKIPTLFKSAVERLAADVEADLVGSAPSASERASCDE